MFVKNKYNSSTLYKSYASAGRDHVGSYIIKHVCIHNAENINSWEGITKEALYIDRLHWFRALTVQMHPGVIDGPFVLHSLISAQ